MLWQKKMIQSVIAGYFNDLTALVEILYLIFLQCQTFYESLQRKHASWLISQL